MPQRLVRLLAIAGTGIALVAACPYGNAEALNSQGIARVDTLVARFLVPRAPSSAVPPSISLAVGVDGRLALAKAYGDARAGEPADERTVYHIGSITKQFTAAAVLRLIEENIRCPLSGAALTLDTPITEIFGDVANWQAKDEPTITVRSLLTMTSNLPNFTRRPPDDTDPWGALPAPRLLAAVKKMSPHGWPNSFEYSNTSYFLLAQIIGALTASPNDGATYRDFVRANTIDKANLSETGFENANGRDEEAASPHYHRRPAFTQPDWLSGSGDMTSTAADLFAWNKAVLAGRVVGPAGLAAMFSDGARVGPTTYYGMGWFIEHDDRWDRYSHSGSVPGFTSYNAIRKSRDGSAWRSVTLLTNSDGVEGLDELADELFDVIDAE